MTQKQWWTLLSALVLGLGINATQAQCPKEGCGKTAPCPAGPGKLIIGTGVNSDGGLTGSVILNERNFNCTKCPTPLSNQGVCEQCPDCDACPGCYQKCPECEDCCTKAQTCSGCSAGKCSEKHGTFTIGVGITLLPGPFPLPVPILNANVTGAKAPAAAVTEPEEKQFIVETRLVEVRSGRREQVPFFPRLTVFEGQTASATLCNGIAQAGRRGDPLPERMDDLLQVQVEELDSGDLRLDLTVQKNTVAKSSKGGTVVLCRRLAAMQEVTPGKPMKLVLEKDDRGGARAWVEVMVKDASEKADAGPMEAAGCAAPDFAYFGQMPVLPCPPLAVPPRMAPPPIPMMPMTVFTPQPLPPQPAAMMPPAPAAASSVPRPRLVSEVIPCNVPTVISMPAANMASIFRAIKENGHARLEVLNGPFSRMICPSMTWGVPGCKPLKFTVAGERVHVSGEQLKAYANRVIADAEDHLVMQGQVRLTYEQNGVPRHIKADKVTIHLHDGHLDVEMKNPSGK